MHRRKGRALHHGHTAGRTTERPLVAATCEMLLSASFISVFNSFNYWTPSWAARGSDCYRLGARALGRASSDTGLGCISPISTRVVVSQRRLDVETGSSCSQCTHQAYVLSAQALGRGQEEQLSAPSSSMMGGGKVSQSSLSRSAITHVVPMCLVCRKPVSEETRFSCNLEPSTSEETLPCTRSKVVVAPPFTGWWIASKNAYMDETIRERGEIFSGAT